MLPKELSDLMWLYARRGIADWNAAPSVLRSRAIECLGTEIAESEWQAGATLRAVYSRTSDNKQLRFIPMPLHPKTSGFERAFFIPVCEAKGNGFSVAFELFLIVNASNKNCLAYRFEPADDPPSTHNYGHVQMSRTLLRKTIIGSTLDWMPVSYPAHPLGTSDPLRMFLSMTTAVHGYHKGIIDVIQEVFVEASRAREVAQYAVELRQMLV